MKATKTRVCLTNVWYKAFSKPFHNQDQVHTIAVEHDKTLQGKTITHQIDVY